MQKLFSYSDIPLLTPNGIPPQVIGALTREQRFLVRKYGDLSRGGRYPLLQNTHPDVLDPLATTTKHVAAIFTSWGATILDSKFNHIQFASSKVQKGGTTFPPDQNLHSDYLHPELGMNALSLGYLSIRLLAVSSMAADFIDLSRVDDMPELLNQYRHHSRMSTFRKDFMDFATAANMVVRPKPWQIIAFDNNTPHLPRGASYPHRRMLMTSWVDMKLPDNWRERVMRGDVPRLNPSALAA